MNFLTTTSPPDSSGAWPPPSRRNCERMCNAPPLAERVGFGGFTTGFYGFRVVNRNVNVPTRVSPFRRDEKINR